MSDDLKSQRLGEILNPSQAGLLVIDLQNDFLSLEGKIAKSGTQDISAMRNILPSIERVTNLFYKRERPVIRTVTYEDPEFRTTAMLDRFLWSEENDREHVVCLKGTWGAELYAPAREVDIVIEKKKLSAHGPELSEAIRNNGIKTLFVVGVKTQRCVESTVRDLYEKEPDLHVVVLEDCVATNDLEQHEPTLKEFKKFYPPVLTSTDLISAWKD